MKRTQANGIFFDETCFITICTTNSSYRHTHYRYWLTNITFGECGVFQVEGKSDQSVIMKRLYVDSNTNEIATVTWLKYTVISNKTRDWSDDDDD